MVTIALPSGGGATEDPDRGAEDAGGLAEGGNLEGIFIAGASGSNRGAVVAPPHPLFGGSIESPVLSEIAYACTKTGIASLRFNWRGVGASAGAPSGDAADADADYRAALAHMGETVGGPIVACGYSFGAAAAVRVALDDPRVDRLVLVAPPPAMLPPSAFERLARPVLVLVGETRFAGGAAPIARARRDRGRCPARGDPDGRSLLRLRVWRISAASPPTG